jgi:hypothetical protein
MQYVRIYSDADGKSQFEDHNMLFPSDRFRAARATPGYICLLAGAPIRVRLRRVAGPAIGTPRHDAHCDS